MYNPFTNAQSSWVKYNSYVWKTAPNGMEYIMPVESSMPEIYDPLENPEEIVLDAIRTGRICMSKDAETEARKAIFDFIRKYGLLGMMTALPTTPRFIEYEKVYLPKNRFIKAETMDTEAYLAHFYPFERPRFKKKGIESSWEIDDPTMAALFLTFQNRLQSQVMTFQRTYGERYDWLKLQFTDWALIAMTCFFYCEDRDNIDPVQRDVYRKALEGFDSTAPGFHYALTDERPVLVWDFHSLSLTLQMLLAFLLTDDQRPLRLCRNCMKPFISETSDEKYCSAKCRKARERGE